VLEEFVELSLFDFAQGLYGDVHDALLGRIHTRRVCTSRDGAPSSDCGVRSAHDPDASQQAPWPQECRYGLPTVAPRVVVSSENPEVTPMSMSTVAKSPDQYVRSLRGWRRECVEQLRDRVKAAAKLDEEIKWGHLVFSSKGPVLLIRAEKERVLFGFWRGQRLREIESALKPGGKYEMATLEIRTKPFPTATVVRKLVREAVKLNEQLGNPQAQSK
jgi:hypothetical protein